MVTLCSVEVFGAIDVRIFGIIFEIMGELAMVEDSVVPKNIYIFFQKITICLIHFLNFRFLVLYSYLYPFFYFIIKCDQVRGILTYEIFY